MQVNQSPDTGFTLLHFNDKVEMITKSQPVTSVKPFEPFAPNGVTALYDAIGYTIDEMGRYYAAQPPNRQPAKVVFTVFTDGHENASVDYALADIERRIAHQQDKYGWSINFVGGDLATVQQFARFKGVNATAYDAGTRGATKNIYEALSVQIQNSLQN